MYRKFYSLSADPFCLDPDLDFLFLSIAHEEAVSHIAYGLEQDETVILITGDIGTGKTLALHRVIGQLSAAFIPVVIGVTTIDFAQFMRLVMFKLGESTPPHDVSGLLNAFEQKLVQARQSGRKVLLVVDEAQDCDDSLLESIRLLLNLAQPGTQVLQLLLVGQIGLEEKLAQPELRQFRQRIRVSYRLESLKRAELEAYVAHRLKVAGRDAPLFSSAALDRIFSLSGGIPRLVNQYASRALLAGFVEDARTIKPAHIESDPQAKAGTTPIESARHSGPDVTTSAHRAPYETDEGTADRGQPDRSAAAPGANAEFATRRPRPARDRLKWLVPVAIAVAAAAATYPKWAPLVNRAGSVAPSAPGRIQEPAPQPKQVADSTVVHEGTSTAAADSAASPQPELPVSAPGVDSNAIADIGAAAAVRSETTPADRSAPGSPEPERPRAGQADLPRSAVQASRPAEVHSATTLASSGRISAPVAPADDGPTSVHVFSFTTQDRAETARIKFDHGGLPTFVSREPGIGGRVWYRVYLGPFEKRADAEAVVDSLKRTGRIEYHSYTHRVPSGS